MRGLSRRAVLRGGAGTAIALPLLNVMRPARAAVTGRPRRFIAFVTTNGMLPERFWPTVPGGRTFTPDYVASGKFYLSGHEALDTTQHTLSPILEPLQPHKADINVVEGLDNCKGIGGHDMYGALLTGWEVKRPMGRPTTTGTSVDQVLGQRIGKDTAYPALQFGVVVGDQGGQFGNCSYYEGMKPAPAQNNPFQMFERLFGSKALDQAALQALLLDRRSVLDAAMGQMTTLEARLPADDRDKLRAHTEALRSLEKRFTGQGGSDGCAPPALPMFDHRASANIPVTTKAQLDLLATAIACDLTRVATFQIGQEGGNLTHPWLGVTTGFHILSHSGPSNLEAFDKIVAINRWYAEQLAYLITRLKAIREGEGTAFDNTAIVWLSGLTKGNEHSNCNQPCVIAGSAGGAFKTGRYVRLARDPKSRRYPLPPGRTLADLHVTLLQAFGFADRTFGDPALCTGPIDVLRA